MKTRRVNGREEIMEKAGIMALAGTLQAIDEGTIRKGETVLSFFTGGAGEFSGREAVPECLIGRGGRSDGRGRTVLERRPGTALPGAAPGTCQPSRVK